MTNCVTKLLRKVDGDKGIFRCVCCGFTTKPIRLTARIGKECSKPCSEALTREVIKAPSLLSQGRAYLDANQRWEAAGRPTRTDEQVIRIVEQACEKCDLFTGTQCLACGCSISHPRDERTSIVGIKFDPARFNKPRMATEDCPFQCKQCGHSKWKHLEGKCECGECPIFIDPRRIVKPP